MSKWKIAAGSAGAGLMLLCILFVWPTRYLNSEMKTGTNIYPIRENRFTGNAEKLTDKGWVKLQAPDFNPVAPYTVADAWDASGNPIHYRSSVVDCYDAQGKKVTYAPATLPADFFTDPQKYGCVQAKP
ncbi:MAG TPA: hypothetical protein VGD60_11150 [Candidatus Acidoferrales bacterium]